MLSASQTISGFDPALSEAMSGGHRRQEQPIELIAAENHTSSRVLQAPGALLTNKYAGGYPGKRDYGGCEALIDAVRALFGLPGPVREAI